MKVVFVSTNCDSDVPFGGTKQTYRHIDVLNQIGINACFAHSIRGFRYTWFENQTPTMHVEDVELTADDFMIFSEVVSEVPRVKGWERCGKVILCQNDYYTFAGFGRDLARIRQCYQEAAAILCPSENSEENLSFMFPTARVMRFKYSFDRTPWEFTQTKSNLVAVMPRKRAATMDDLLAVTSLSGRPPGWGLLKVDGFSEKDVAEAFKKCAVFLSLSEREGFGMPPAEAMSCGCIAVGYTGFAGAEYMIPGIAVPVRDGDFLGLARSLVGVLNMPLEERTEMALKASTFIRAAYSTQAEVDSIKAAWAKITRPVVEIRTVPDVSRRNCRIKAVIMHHNKPENADRLYEQLAPVFDDVEIFDNGSDPGKIPVHVTRVRGNVFWTGTWNEVMTTCADYDAVWVLGCDIELRNKPEEYREALESSLPFGCWSPCIDGRAHPFMRAEHYGDRKPREVRNVEGMALAVSGALLKQIGTLPMGSQIGFGQDYWMCHRARKAGLRNIIDGRVVVRHPEGIGYDEGEAIRQMEATFGGLYGPDFRRTIFEYDERFEYNVVVGERVMAGNKPFTIVTVDNGWGLAEFVRITSKIGDCRRIVMRKGIIENVPVPGIEFVPYDEKLEILLKEADVALFPRVGVSNSEDYQGLLRAGVPVVVREACAQNKIEHMKNGWLFRDEPWAEQWLAFLRANPGERERVRREAVQTLPVPVGSVKVTVITPTYHRDLTVVKHCIDCMLLQTEKDWEQIVCSDGESEPGVQSLVESIGDPRVRYFHTNGKKEGDYGNTVRAECLKMARGKYILFFDDDNLILPSYLDHMVVRLENSPDCGFAVCQIMHFGPLNEKEIGKAPQVLTGEPMRLYHIDPLQVLVRRDKMLAVGWDTTVGYLSDGVSLERLGKSCFGVRVDEVLGIHV